ncbi:MAG: hypothetical protein EPO29_00800 [Betaproteobacteria bacterium]|nr:MAG: hypothetical protein EPO29_00800 [Betaproteobacteria bacterium]
MFKIEKTRAVDPDAWQDADRGRAIDKARAALVAPGDVVTVTDSGSGETLWMAVFGRDGRCHEWSGQEPRQVRVSPLLSTLD